MQANAFGRGDLGTRSSGDCPVWHRSVWLPGGSGYDRFLLLVLLVLTVSIRGWQLDRPFGANNEGTATGIPLAQARNLARYGPVASRFAGVLNTGEVPPSAWTYYAHHPPLVPLLIAGVYSVAGVSEWSSRLAPALFSIASTILLYLVATGRYGPFAGFTAGVFYAGAPFTVAFGGMPDYINGQLAFFTLAAIVSYLRWHETGRRRYLYGAALCFVLGALSDWPMYYVVPVVAAHHFFASGGRRLSRTLALVAFPALLLVLQVLWMDSINGSGAFLRQFGTRSLPPDMNIARSDFQLVARNITYLHTLPVVLLSGTYIVLLLQRRWRNGPSALRGNEIPILLLAAAVLHFVVGLRGATQTWWAAPATAPLALTAALGLEWLVGRLGSRRGLSLAIVVALGFAGSSIAAAPSEFEEWSPVQSIGYSVRDLAWAIQEVSEPHEGVLTTHYFLDPVLWFYVDRQLRPDIVVIEQLAAALAPGPYPLPFGYAQEHGPAPRWMVVPTVHREQMAELIRELEVRFPSRDLGRFVAYQLR